MPCDPYLKFVFARVLSRLSRVYHWHENLAAVTVFIFDKLISVGLLECWAGWTPQLNASQPSRRFNKQRCRDMSQSIPFKQETTSVVLSLRGVAVSSCIKHAGERESS